MAFGFVASASLALWLAQSPLSSPVNVVRQPGQQVALVTTAAGEMKLEQTGDSIGASSITLHNRAAENGLIIKVEAVDLADIILRGSSGTQRSIRLENRGIYQYLGDGPEIQVGDMSDYPGGIGLLANANGAGVNRGSYFRWLGGTSGYVGVVAPNAPTSYTLTLPSALGAAGKCLGLASGSQLGWNDCGGGDLALPVYMTQSGTNKVQFFQISGNAAMELRNSSNIYAASLATSVGGSSLTLKDTNGDGDAQLYAGDSGGATLDLYQRDRSWIGAKLAGGAFNDDFGKLQIYSHTSPETTNRLRAQLDTRLRLWQSCASCQPSLELGINGAGAGEIRIRSAIGLTVARIDDLGYWFNGSQGATTTINVTCSGGGTGTISINGGLVTNTTCP